MVEFYTGDYGNDGRDSLVFPEMGGMVSCVHGRVLVRKGACVGINTWSFSFGAYLYSSHVLE